MKKSQLRKIIRENIRQVMAEQGNPPTGGSWPGFMQWTSTFSGTLYSVQNPCNFLHNRYTILINKLNALGGGTGIPNTQAGIDHAVMLVMKLVFMASWINAGCSAGLTACCGLTLPVEDPSDYDPNTGIIPEQRGGGLPPIPEHFLALVSPSALAQARSAAEASVQKYIAQNPGGGVGAQNLREQGGFNLSSWIQGQQTLLNGGMFGTPPPPHPNPCNYLGNRIAAQTAKMNALGGGTGNPSTPQGVAHKQMLQQKIQYWQTVGPQFGCQPGT